MCDVQVFDEHAFNIRAEDGGVAAGTFQIVRHDDVGEIDMVQVHPGIVLHLDMPVGERVFIGAAHGDAHAQRKSLQRPIFQRDDGLPDAIFTGDHRRGSVQRGHIHRRALRITQAQPKQCSRCLRRRYHLALSPQVTGERAGLVAQFQRIERCAYCCHDGIPYNLMTVRHIQPRMRVS